MKESSLVLMAAGGMARRFLPAPVMNRPSLSRPLLPHRSAVFPLIHCCAGVRPIVPWHWMLSEWASHTRSYLSCPKSSVWKLSPGDHTALPACYLHEGSCTSTVAISCLTPDDFPQGQTIRHRGIWPLLTDLQGQRPPVRDDRVIFEFGTVVPLFLSVSEPLEYGRAWHKGIHCGQGI